MKTLYALCLLLLSSGSFALTNITTPSVSGNWTLAGSPYIVQVSVSVPAAGTLKIDPGVEVRFNAGTKMNVYGKLIARGLSGQSIVFRANDTTGWSLMNTTAGGWNGLHFMPYGGAGTDSSAFEYCVLRDGKFGYNNVVSDVNPFLSYRKIALRHCDFTHNTSGTGMYTAGTVIQLSTQAATDTIEIDNCTFSDNSSVFGILRFENYAGGYTHIQRSRLFNNHDASPMWGSWFNALIENNEIDHNVMINDASPIKLSIGKATVRGNKVHHNQCEQLAAIGCRSGKIDIDNNLICNNEQLDGNCGATGGGGGIHVAHNEGGANFADTYYRIRNNVIANNFSAYGGGGVYVYHARADILNNTIVNNRASTGMGNGILILDPASEVKVKNNLFKGNANAGWGDSLSVIYILTCNTLHYDYNYSPGSYSQSVTGNLQNLSQLIGDTSHNVIGTAPLLIAPTANNLVSTDATAANFGIQALSPCVDKGDTVGASPLPYDYAGGNRIMGSKIDIGAYEVVKSNPEGIAEAQRNTLFQCYPNPARDVLMVRSVRSGGQLQLSTVDGRVLINQAMDGLQTRIPTGALPRGIYLLRLSAEQETATEKIILE